MSKEFQEIAHSGGTVTFRISNTPSGGKGYQVQFTSDRPVPTRLIQFFAAMHGKVTAPRPFPGAFLVMVASDSSGMFGHACPNCDGYWRSGPLPVVCPYCGQAAESLEFMSNAQRRYVRHYCEVLENALESIDEGEVSIDMDAVADATEKEEDRPAFYVSEESQQCKFTCGACDEQNDILGRFGYCSLCGTRNDLADFELLTVVSIRERLNGGGAPESCLRDAVASFDSFLAQVILQLTNLIPMSERRKTRLSIQGFHNVKEVQKLLSDWFDIDMFAGIAEAQRASVILMFYRRHVHEHNGGEVDQRYLDNSGDKTARLKQHLRESQEGVHELLGSLLKMARNIHRSFHELFPPSPEPIKMFQEQKARMAKFDLGSPMA